MGGGGLRNTIGKFKNTIGGGGASIRPKLNWARQHLDEWHRAERQWVEYIARMHWKKLRKKRDNNKKTFLTLETL